MPGAQIAKQPVSWFIMNALIRQLHVELWLQVNNLPSAVCRGRSGTMLQVVLPGPFGEQGWRVTYGGNVVRHKSVPGERWNHNGKRHGLVTLDYANLTGVRIMPVADRLASGIEANSFTTNKCKARRQQQQEQQQQEQQQQEQQEV